MWQERVSVPLRLGDVELTVNSPQPSCPMCTETLFSVSAVIVPKKALKLMRDRKEEGSDPRLKPFKSVRALVFRTSGLLCTRRL